MIDFRLYRFALLAVPLAAVIAMFSLQGGAVSALRAGSRPTPSMRPTAAPLAKQLAESAAYPTPGSAADKRWPSRSSRLLRDRRRDRLGAALRRLLPRPRRRPAQPDRHPAGRLRPPDRADRAARRRPGQRRRDHRGRDRGAAPDRRRLLRHRPPQDPRLRLDRRLERRRARARSASSATTATPACSTPRSCSASRRCSTRPLRWSSPGRPGRRARPASSTRPRTRPSRRRPRRRPATRDRSPTSSGSRCRPGLGEQGPLIEAGLPAVRLSSDGELPLDPARTPRTTSTPTPSTASAAPPSP